ncbi:hypothetical protein [Pseudomonas koreensis]|uniref:Uncharacterized protein n=1 Tax=Pseudomonas koreensis TaxID=198620 RepID=A0AA94ENX5_9PSED|nr:hypothetical protein [Pseudomonas koreensis]RVD77068.1 hypothetical protein A9HBioS_3091 [Pseudomonas koreensis]
MTNNPTIDGVPRRMLTALLCHVSEFENRALVDELRALLDAPAVERQVAKCGQCGSTSAEICNQNGCGFLESGNGEPELATLQSTIAQLQARVQELESGRGELKCWSYKLGGEQRFYPTDPRKADFGGYAELMSDVEPLFTAPPAPAAVVLPERKQVTVGLLSESNTYNYGWNTCLDATAALNGDRK